MIEEAITFIRIIKIFLSITNILVLVALFKSKIKFMYADIDVARAIIDMGT